MASSEMLRRVALVRTDVSDDLSASIIRVTRIGEIRNTLAVTSNRRTLADVSVFVYVEMLGILAFVGTSEDLFTVLTSVTSCLITGSSCVAIPLDARHPKTFSFAFHVTPVDGVVEPPSLMASCVNYVT
jgi:hypothetical protein